MLHSKTLAHLQSWTSVVKWTLLGTLFCVLVSLIFNIMMFDSLGGSALHRALITATVLPCMLALPSFLFLSIRIRGLALRNRRLGAVARTDSLTACLNRGAFTSRVGRALAECAPDAKGGLLMIDADNFKAINDLHGHDYGDEALTIIARSIRAVLQPGDLLGRIGGEEFAVYLPDQDHQQADATAERIRRAVCLANFAPEGSRHGLSVSIGGAVVEGRSSFAELFRIADKRLYHAKNGGRNRTALVTVRPSSVPELRQSA